MYPPKTSIYLGDEAVSKGSHLDMKFPVQRSKVVDWDMWNLVSEKHTALTGLL
jgi:hypothetical protein